MPNCLAETKMAVSLANVSAKIIAHTKLSSKTGIKHTTRVIRFLYVYAELGS